ncbi:uncharacterized protein SAPINGB_P000144 [Magnusiomyces paraingens]|uniref:Peptidase S8/S53 domain-containing protein n=1 Tax=Magnusiomyces paraingens TaxID=2606893 RepID=A0A5E8AYM2_9ASCO|nr:uncharacterized protein SAPINGB_P000144 [Saprochaete ingens]VVT43784.1 unnamed protein product [Saprochaete ingens]
MKVAVVAASLLPLAANVANAIYIPTDPEMLAQLSRLENGNRIPVPAVPVAQAPVDTPVAPKMPLAPFATSEHAKKNLVEDSYIIIFNDNVDEALISQHLVWLGDAHAEAVSALHKRDSQHPFLMAEGEEALATGGLKHVYNIPTGLKGYAGRFLPETIEAIRTHSSIVKYVEHDSRVFASEFATEKDAPWGLARISHKRPLSLSTFNKYLYDDDGGEGVTSYVIDTGTNIDHVDFGGRASWGKTIPSGDSDSDGNGHGTHCSGTIAGEKYGVAKKASIVAVKVLRSNGSGTMSDVLKGVEWAASAHIAAVKANKKGFKGSTANMSLGGGKSPSLDLAVNAAVKAGIHFAVAAGNDNADACNYSPAAAADAVTVGASDISDVRAYFSNYGKCVDIFGPGVNIQSTYIGSKYAVATLSGTSMASPHVAGILSYFLSLQPASDSEYAVAGAVTPAQLKKNLISYSTSGILEDIPADTPNKLIFNGAGGNITDFWSHGAAAAAAASSDAEQSFRISEELKHISEDVGGFLDGIRERLLKGVNY